MILELLKGVRDRKALVEIEEYSNRYLFKVPSDENSSVLSKVDFRFELACANVIRTRVIIDGLEVYEYLATLSNPEDVETMNRVHEIIDGITNVVRNREEEKNKEIVKKALEKIDRISAK